MKNNNLKKTIRQIHLWLGLSTGLVVFIVAVTGCLWVFKTEIESFYSDYKTVNPINKEYITASKVKEIASKENPNRTVHGVVFGQPDEALEIIYYEAEPELFYQSLFLNPYSGEVIKQVDNTGGFFGFILKGHVRLWLPEAVGSVLVSYSILLFFVLIITGLILWWPKKSKNLQQRIKFDWNNKTRWKRKNFDLHTVIGFYTSALAIILTFTGCVMAFGWFYYITYKALGGDKNPRFLMPNNEQIISKIDTDELRDILIPTLKKEYKNARNFELHFPENDSTSILVEVCNSDGLHYDMDYLYFDQYTLKELEPNSIYSKYKNANFADKVVRMNYDIHIGAIGGIVGKIIAFIASLLCASLPITGFLLWWGRKYK
ncbi:PepSY-associated TM helix domain-containing protein [Flavobacterium sp.]|uniref:PepSY-associated TM helix domain-containing protein n=1 Tax=Flavobacterium sp. TaxID=239 RepID=UPI004047B424